MTPEYAVERPFFFMVVLWGERFREYFLEYCLPSMLAPGNIPALSTKQPSKFLIATRPEDWEAMKGTPIFKLMERYVTPVYLEIPPCPPGLSGCEHMSIGHKLACEMAHRESAYTVLLTPDCILSDGAVRRMQELVAQGVQIVLVTAMRAGEEPFLAKLQEFGAIPAASRRDTATPIAATARQLVAATIKGFHSESLRYEWDTSYLTPFHVSLWWNVPNDDGIVVHSFAWAPLMMDHGAFKTHDTTTLETWTIDGDYAFKNLSEKPIVHVVTDSDEIFHCSWAPLAERELSIAPVMVQKTRILGYIAKGENLRNTYHSGIFDPLKQMLFFATVRWHAKPLNENWEPVEQRARQTVSRFVNNRATVEWMQGSGIKFTDTAGAPIVIERTGLQFNFAMISTASAAFWAAHRILLAIAMVPWRIVLVIAECWRHKATIAKRIGEMFRGDHEARRRVIWRISAAAGQIVGRFTTLSGPPPQKPAAK